MPTYLRGFPNGGTRASVGWGIEAGLRPVDIPNNAPLVVLGITYFVVLVNALQYLCSLVYPQLNNNKIIFYILHKAAK